MWLSWKHRDSDFSGPLTFDEKVELFCEQTLGWQLHIADLITNGGTTFPQPRPDPEPPEPGYPVRDIRHSGFAVLQICLSYFEVVGSFVSAKKQSTPRFEAGVREVLPGIFKNTPDDDDMLDRLYTSGRCGLYHAARTGLAVGLAQPSDGSPMAYDPKAKRVGINPHRLPDALIKHLEKLKAELLDPANADIRRRFEKRFDEGFI
jgi:hypothetical protein